MPQKKLLTGQRCCSVFIWLLGVMINLVALSAAGVTYAAESDDKAEQRKYANVKTRQRQAVGKNCANKLQGIQEIFSGETELTADRYSQIIRELRSFLETSCSSSYEKSQVYNMLGFAYYSVEQYKEAIASYLSMLAEPKVDERQKTTTHYTLAQLYLIEENYSQAAKQLENWMADATIVSAEGRVLLAQAYYHLERKQEALGLVNTVIDEAVAKGLTPKEGWWLLQRVLYYEKQEYPRVIDILKQLVTYYPKQTYWQQLGGVYGQLEQNINRLVSLDVLNLSGGLSSERQLLSLAYLYLGAEVPYRAARIIESGLASGAIKVSGKNYDLLGSAWLQSRETEKALIALEHAAKLSNSGETWSRLSAAYLDINRNADAVRAARNALRVGGLKQTALVQMTLGNALVNLHCYRDAITVFIQAAENVKSRKTANQWVQYITGEAARRDRLTESGADLPSCQQP